MRGWLLRVALLAAVLTAGQADAAEAPSSTDIEQAARLLSAFPTGMMPPRDDVIEAIEVLAEQGDRTEISLLRNVAIHERLEVRGTAAAAIEHIRARQRVELRAAFVDSLPAEVELTVAAAEHRQFGLGNEAARCAAYAEAVLSGPKLEVEMASDEHLAAEDLLAAGMPRRALIAAMSDQRPEARHLEAQAREELGDVSGALHEYALLASRGDNNARDELDDFGVDAERLLLGMMVGQKGSTLDLSSDAATLDVLVRHGEELTATVLAERTVNGSLAVRAVATDALGRMLSGSGRPHPLSARGKRIAQRALAEAARTGPEDLASIAREALP